jgi:hypothetical protein
VIVAKFLFLSCLILLFTSCNQNPDCLQKEDATTPAVTCPTPTPAPTPESLPSEEVPNEALIFDAKFSLFNFEREDEDKVLKAIEIIKKVVATREFRDRILNYTYQGKKQFVDNKGFTNAQVYQILLDGKEDLKPEVDHEMDLELELYYTWNSTVGYTTADVLRIHMNTKYFDPYTPSEVAGNVFHEWTHKLGFDHATTYSVERDSSVPYAIGYLIKELRKKYE